MIANGCVGIDIPLGRCKILNRELLILLCDSDVYLIVLLDFYTCVYSALCGYRGQWGGPAPFRDLMNITG